MKLEPAPRGSTRLGRTCANPKCERRVMAGDLACRQCWFALPKLLRDAIWRTFRANDRMSYSSNVMEARRLWLKKYREGGDVSGRGRIE